MKINLNPLALVLYVNSLPAPKAGEAMGPVVRIVKDYVGDEGLLAHELEHVRQFWTLFFFFGVLPFAANWIAGSPLGNLGTLLLALGVSAHAALYLLVPRYRLWAELRAYSVQLKHMEPREHYAAKYGTYIAEHYRLNISANEATSRLLSMNT